MANGGKITREYSDGVEWVLAGEGVATQKMDGTCCLIKDGVLWKRYEVKRGGTPPYGFLPANEVDENTGKQQGWVKVGNGSEDRWHQEAFAALDFKNDGTYELMGPKIQGNPEGFKSHFLIAHANVRRFFPAPPTDYNGLRDWLAPRNIEGLVWHHPDGRMVKIKKKDFDLPRINSDQR